MEKSQVNVIEEEVDFLNDKPTPINYGNCRAIVNRTFRQCHHKAVREEQGKGICRIHYAMLRRGKKVAYIKERTA